MYPDLRIKVFWWFCIEMFYDHMSILNVNIQINTYFYVL